MRFAIVKSAAELGERAFYEIKRVLDAKPDAVIGFATGRPPLPLYEKMAEDHRKNGTSYKRVTAINLDEYVGIEAKNKNSTIILRSHAQGLGEETVGESLGVGGGG